MANVVENAIGAWKPEAEAQKRIANTEKKKEIVTTVLNCDCWYSLFNFLIHLSIHSIKVYWDSCKLDITLLVLRIKKKERKKRNISALREGLV